MPRIAQKGWTNSYINKLMQELSAGRPFIYLQDHAYKQDQRFYDKLELDPQIRAAMENVATDVAGIDWTLTADKDADLVPLYKDALKNIRQFNAARMIMAKQTLMRGFSVHQIEWDAKILHLGNDSRMRRWVVPVRLMDIGVDRVRRSAEPIEGDTTGAKVFRWNIWDHQDRLWKQLDKSEEWQYVWSVYLPEEATMGYGNGIGKSLYYLYRLKTVLLELVAGFAERSVDSWIVLKLEQLAETDNLYEDVDAIDNLIDVVEKMRASGILAVTGESEVTTLNPSTNQWQLMTEMLDKLDRQILILIKGSNMDMDMEGGGSYAAAKTHHEVSNKRLVLQRETVIAEPLSNWLIPAFYHLNRSNFKDMGREIHESPTFNVSGGDVFNPQERLPIFQDALDRGIKVSEKDYYEQLGLSQVEDGEPIIHPKPPEQPGGGGFPGGPMGGGGFGGGDDHPQPPQHPGGFSQHFDASPQPEVPRSMPFDTTPAELQDAIDLFTSKKARQRMGEKVDMASARAEFVDRVRKVMAYADASGQMSVIDEAGDTKEKGFVASSKPEKFVRWITIGGDEDDENGGTHVQISESGTILKGPKGWTGKTPKELHGHLQKQNKAKKKGRWVDKKKKKEKPSAPKKSEKVKSEAKEENKDEQRRESIKSAFDEIKKSNDSVTSPPLSDLYKEMLKKDPSLDTTDFLKSMVKLAKHGDIDFNLVNDLDEVDNPDLAIRTAAGIINYATWNDDNIKTGPLSRNPGDPIADPASHNAHANKERMKSAQEAFRKHGNDPSHWDSKDNTYYRPGPNPTVDNIITRDGVNGKELLMIKREEGTVEGGKWALPGGFHDTEVGKGAFWTPGKETAQEASLRELTEETEMNADVLKEKMRHVGYFDKHGRDPRDNDESWAVSNAFHLHIDGDLANSKVQGMDDAAEAEWVPVSEVHSRDLAFDHGDIIKKAGI